MRKARSMSMRFLRSALLLAVWGGGCGKGAPVPVSAQGAAVVDLGAAAPSEGVQLGKVRAASELALLEAPGQVLLPPSAVAEVAPPFRSQVLEVHVQPGQVVAAGAAVATVLMPEVLRAAGTYVGASLRSQAYELRKKQLIELKAEGLMRLADQAENDARLAEARASQEEARAVLQVAGVSGAEASQLVESEGGRRGRLVLRSPLAGTVTAVKAVLGQQWDVGAPPLARILAAGEPRIEARLLTGVPEGSRFEVRTPSGQVVALRLLGRAPAVDGRDGSTLAWFAPAEEAQKLHAGLLPGGLAVKVRIRPAAAPEAGREKTVVVPGRALRWADGKPTVLRQGARGTGESVAVRVLATLGADALVAAALEPGESVVLDASLHASQGPGGVEP